MELEDEQPTKKIKYSQVSLAVQEYLDRLLDENAHHEIIPKMDPEFDIAKTPQEFLESLLVKCIQVQTKLLNF